MSYVVVERRFPQPIELAELATAARAGQGCLARHDVRYHYGYIAPDRQRMVCVFEAPDAESVRIADRQAGMPFERAYTVTLHEPAASSHALTRAALPVARPGMAVVDVLVERSFPEPVDFAEVQALENSGAWCLDEHGVSFVRTYFAIDRCRMLCRYTAADAESVRIVNRRLGLPFDSVWPITHFSLG